MYWSIWVSNIWTLSTSGIARIMLLVCVLIAHYPQKWVLYQGRLWSKWRQGGREKPRSGTTITLANKTTSASCCTHHFRELQGYTLLGVQNRSRTMCFRIAIAILLLSVIVIAQAYWRTQQVALSYNVLFEVNVSAVSVITWLLRVCGFGLFRLELSRVKLFNPKPFRGSQILWLAEFNSVWRSFGVTKVLGTECKYQ